VPARPKPGPNVRRRGNTRARLLAAALEVFTQTSPRGVSVEELVAAAGFTRGAFYSNFASMDEVFYALFEQQSALMLDSLRDAIDEMPAIDLDLESINEVLDALRPHGRDWYILQSELLLAALRDEAARVRFEAFRARFQGELAEVIGGVLARLGRRASPSLPALTDAVAALYLSSLASEHLGSESGSPETVQTILPRVVLSLSVPLDH
jgi:AcrR family transcriptional regulator